MGKRLGARSPKLVRLILLGFGYGCYLSFFPIGPLGTVFLTELASGWDTILLSRVLFELSTVVAILAWRHRGAEFISRHPGAIRASFLAAIASTCLINILVPVLPSGLAAPLFWALLGILTASPKLYWYESFYLLYREQGRSRLLVCLALGFFVAAAAMPLSSLMAQTVGATAPVAGSICLSWVCVELGKMHAADVAAGKSLPALSVSYTSSTYMKIVTASFGVSWAFSYTVAVGNGFGESAFASPSTGVMFAGIALCTLLMLFFSRSEWADKLRFNEMLRWVIVCVAAIWAVMPLASDALSALACFLCSAAYIFQSVLMILLIVEMCEDYRVSVVSVTAAHYGRFIAFACLSSFAYWLLSSTCPPRITLEAVAAICVISTVACVPILPSRKSRAMVLAMDSLPEEKSRAEVLKEAMTRLAQTRGLTPRETQVMGMLVQGASRTEMAEALCVSAWTVKNHVASVYSKTEVHSVPELVSLLEHSNTSQ